MGGDEVYEDAPPWDGFAESWQAFAEATWFEAMKSLVDERFEVAARESRSGRLEVYFARVDAKAALDLIGPVHHAFGQPPVSLNAALRLA